MRTEFVHKHRPKKLSDVVGQDNAVKELQGYIDNDDMPHALLFTGDSGCGKTTLARILMRKLKANRDERYEINAAESRGIATIREISENMPKSPMYGPTKVYLLDEAHQLSGDAQSALLKMLEDPRDHTYFMLATTNPGKLLKTILTRCTQIKCPSVKDKAMKELMSGIAEKEKIREKYFTNEVQDKICEVAQGSPRRALVILHQIRRLKSDEEMLDAIDKSDMQNQAFDLARVLINPRSQWHEVQKIILNFEDDAEFARQVIMNYMKSVLLKSGQKRAAAIIEILSEGFYDSRTGVAMLTMQCHKILHLLK